MENIVIENIYLRLKSVHKTLNHILLVLIVIAVILGAIYLK